MKQDRSKTSRERTDIFYRSNRKLLKSSSKSIALAVIAMLILLFLAYQFGYYVGEAAYKKGL
jgi:ABC-type spermidine/putrescine transport system permease subunit I